MRLSRAIRMAMEDRGRSGRWLATRIGVQPRTVAAWLDGRSVPNYLQVLDIARELKVSEALFREEETPHSDTSTVADRAVSPRCRGVRHPRGSTPSSSSATAASVVAWATCSRKRSTTRATARSRDVNGWTDTGTFNSPNRPAATPAGQR